MMIIAGIVALLCFTYSAEGNGVLYIFGRG